MVITRGNMTNFYFHRQKNWDRARISDPLPTFSGFISKTDCQKIARQFFSSVKKHLKAVPEKSNDTSNFKQESSIKEPNMAERTNSRRNTESEIPQSTVEVVQMDGLVRDMKHQALFSFFWYLTQN